MKDKLLALIDKPVILKTVPENARWEPIKGILFEVSNDSVDILIGRSFMKTVRIAAVIDVIINERVAREMILENPPAHPEYARGKRFLFEAEQLLNLKQSEADVKAKLTDALGCLRRVRAQNPCHIGTEQMIERAHYLATGKYDYEVEPGVTSGDVQNHNYIWAKDLLKQVDESLRLRRHEDEIASLIHSLARYAGRAIGKYPNHADLKAWFEKAEKIRGKLSDDVRRAGYMTEPFIPGKVEY